MHSVLRRRAAAGLASMASTSQIRLDASLSLRTTALRMEDGRRRAYTCTSRSCKGSTVASITEAQDSLLQNDPEGYVDSIISAEKVAASLNIDDTAIELAAAVEDLPPTPNVHAQELDPSILSIPVSKHATENVKGKLLVDHERAKKVVLPSNKQPHTHLPRVDEWNTVFPRSSGITRNHRWFLSNPDTCKSVVKALKLNLYVKKHLPPGEKLTIVEGYAGPGIMTKTFLESDAVGRVVSMEDNVYLAQGLANLQVDSRVRNAASRLRTVCRSAFLWETYDDLLAAGMLDTIPGLADLRRGKVGEDAQAATLDDESWTKPSSVLFFAQLPNVVHSEQLLSQLLRSIANRLWLFRYSRVRIALLCSDHTAQRMVATSGKLRGKLTLIAGAQADVEILMTPEHFEPYHRHCWPPVATQGATLPVTRNSSSIRTSATTLAGRKSSGPKLGQSLVLIEPKVKPLITGPDMDAYDYVTKHLLVLRSHPVGKALLHLAPGAENLLKMLRSGSHPALRDLGPVDIDPEQSVNSMPLEHFVALARIFERWPFRPDYLFDEGRQEDLEV